MSRLQCLGHIWPVCLVQQFARCRTLERVARFQDFQILKECTDLYSVRMARAAGKIARFTLTSFLIFVQISLAGLELLCPATTASRIVHLAASEPSQRFCQSGGNRSQVCFLPSLSMLGSP